MASPTAIALKWLRTKQGYTCDVVERFVSQVKREDGGFGVRRDFLHCIDIICCKPGQPVLGVQVTSASNASARKAKARMIPELRTWLSVARFWVLTFVKRDGRWAPRVEELKLDDMDAISVETVTKPARKRAKSRWGTAEALFEIESTETK